LLDVNITSPTPLKSEEEENRKLRTVQLCTDTDFYGGTEACVEGDGSWVGMYTRKLEEDTVIFSLNGHGTGVLEGLHIKRNDVNERGNPPAPFTGYILNPGSKWEPPE